MEHHWYGLVYSCHILYQCTECYIQYKWNLFVKQTCLCDVCKPTMRLYRAPIAANAWPRYLHTVLHNQSNTFRKIICTIAYVITNIPQLVIQFRCWLTYDWLIYDTVRVSSPPIQAVGSTITTFSCSIANLWQILTVHPAISGWVWCMVSTLQSW